MPVGFSLPTCEMLHFAYEATERGFLLAGIIAVTGDSEQF